MRASGDSGARRYEILVRGELGDHFGSSFEDVTLTRVEGNTALTGTVDQPRLRDLLDRIQELGLELVSVRPLDARESVSDEAERARPDDGLRA